NRPPAGTAAAAVITAAKEAVGGERLPEQEPGEQAGAETEAAPVRRGEAGVDVVDRGAVDLHLAHLGLDALIDLVRAGRASRYVAAGPAIRGRPVDVAHRHAVPRIEEARRAPIRLWLAGRDGFGAGQVVVSLGDGLADGPHIRGPPGRIERRGPALIGAQCRALFLRRLRVAADGDVGVMVGEPGAERDQVVLRGRPGLLEL